MRNAIVQSKEVENLQLSYKSFIYKHEHVFELFTEFSHFHLCVEFLEAKDIFNISLCK
jgi:hypothetical protein